ncbi:MAG: hypothetical protein ACRD19_00840, partial [Terriglobia bacterium]
YIQRAYHGPNSNNWKVQELVPREVAMLVPMVAILIWLGIYPQPVFNVFNQSSAVTMDEKMPLAAQAPSSVTHFSLLKLPGDKQ